MIVYKEEYKDVEELHLDVLDQINEQLEELWKDGK